MFDALAEQQQQVGEDDEQGIPSLMSIVVDRPEGDGEPPLEPVVLPKALEEVLARHAIVDEVDFYPVPSAAVGVVTDYAGDGDADSEEEEEEERGADFDSTDSPPAAAAVVAAAAAAAAEPKKSAKVDRNKKKKERKKKNNRKKGRQTNGVQGERQAETIDTESSAEKQLDSVTPVDVQVEYVPEKITVADLAPMYRQFYRVFEVFRIQETKPAELTKPSDQPTDEEKAAAAAAEAAKVKGAFDDDDDSDSDSEGGAGKEKGEEGRERMSKRKMKKLTRLSVAELKQLVTRPDVVEMHDVTARDPKLLVQLKSQRNTVPVPRHWCFKRKYLQGKRGIEKPPFDLPAFIKKTGIQEMRASLQERDESKTLKAKMRERVRPKMGKIDIDYQKLHDAFFKWQTKPRMTIHGDLYYEGKEFETRLKEKKPGDLSEELRIALGMPIGPNCHKIPPPWLIAQQRYGPPPSYPSLKIPGLNAPIPDGTSFGYHAGGWGKPPVDENGKPLYGDVFGMSGLDADSGIDEGEIDRALWGELESESEESSEEEDEEDGDGEGEGGEDMTQTPDESGLVTPAEGLVTPSGLTSIPVGMETPDTIELRKKKIETEMEE